jgi:glycosyltransferase involved in cell wall biosynthesis
VSQLPAYSVVVTAYNVEPWIEGCLRSCLEQTISPREIIVVDDGSEDNTWKRVQEVQAEHPALVVATRQENAGSQTARNEGLRKANSEWIQFLDADDELFPEKVEHQLRLGTTSGAAVVAGSFVRGRTRRNALRAGRVVRSGPYRDSWTNLFRSGCGITSANLFRRDAVEACGQWNPDQPSSQEYELMFRIMKQGGTFVFDENILTFVRTREDSLSDGFGCPQRISHAMLRLAITEHLDGSDLLTLRRRRSMADGYLGMLRATASCDLDVATRLYNVLFKRLRDPIGLKDPFLFALLCRVVGFRNAFRTRKFLAGGRRTILDETRSGV